MDKLNLTFHKCKEEDWTEFYQPDKKSEELLNFIEDRTK